MAQQGHDFPDLSPRRPLKKKRRSADHGFDRKHTFRKLLAEKGEACRAIDAIVDEVTATASENDGRGDPKTPTPPHGDGPACGPATGDDPMAAAASVREKLLDQIAVQTARHRASLPGSLEEEFERRVLEVLQSNLLCLKKAQDVVQGPRSPPTDCECEFEAESVEPPIETAEHGDTDPELPPSGEEDQRPRVSPAGGR
mgnify:CR=1 FL=1